MKLLLSASFKKDFQKLPPSVKKKAERQLKTLSLNLSYPSLRVKKMKGEFGKLQFWEARIDQFWRLSFQKVGDGIRFCRIGPHDRVLKSR